MRWRVVAAIAKRDLLAVRRSKAIYLPIILVPIIILGIIPVAVSMGANYLDPNDPELADVLRMLERMPEWLQAKLAHLELRGKFLVMVLTQMMAPMFLVIPLMVSSVVAADSIAGEKERKTLEPLLYAPITQRELFVGKLAGAWTLALAVTFIGFAIYAGLVDVTTYGVVGELLLPNATWWVLVLVVCPALAAMALAAMVLISARVKGFQEAYQLSGILVLPVLMILVGQITGVMVLSPWGTFALGAFLWTLDVILIFLGARLFRREKLLASQ